MKKWIAFLSLAVVLCAACQEKPKTGDAVDKSISAPAAESNSIVIGSILALSGGQASFGINTKKGIELAIQQIEASGGLLGKKIKLVSMDDQSKPEEAATIMTRLATQDKVVAVLGDIASSNSLAMAPIAQANHVPMVSPSSTNPKVTAVGDYIFRVCFIDPFQGTVMAKFAMNTLGAKRVAILRDMKNDYSIGLADFFAKTFVAMGGEIVSDESYAEGDVDFKSQLTSIKAKNPEAIFVPGYYTEVGLVARQAQELGVTVPLLGGDGWDSTKLTEIGGAAMNGNYFSNHYSPDDPSPVGQKFLADFKAAYGIVPDGMAVTGYDAMLVLADAIQRAGSTEPEALRAALAQTTNFPGASGTITIDAARNAVKPAVVLRVQDGHFVFQEKVEP